MGVKRHRQHFRWTVTLLALVAAAGLVAAGLAGDLKEGVRMGAEAIDSGQAAATLAKLRAFGARHARKQ